MPIDLDEVLRDQSPAREPRLRIPELEGMPATKLRPRDAFDRSVMPNKLDSIKAGLRAAGGNLGAAADMILNLPVQLMGIGADYGTRASAIGSGETRRIGAQAGREAAGYVMENFGNPVQKLMKVLGYGESYNESDVTKAMQTFSSWMDKGGEAVERMTRGGILKEDFASLADLAMAKGGLSGVEATARAMRRRAPTGAGNRAGYDAAAAEEAFRSDAAVRARQDAFLAENPQFKPPQEGTIPPGRTPAQERFLAENPQYRGRQADAPTTEFDSPSGERGVFTPEEGQVKLQARGDIGGEGRVIGELPPALDTALEKVRAGERPTLTPEELIALREFERGERPPIVLPEKFRDAKGAADPKLLAGLASLGLGTIIGSYAYDNLDPESGLGMALPFIGVGAVKEKGGMWHPESIERLALPLRNRMRSPAEDIGSADNAHNETNSGPAAEWANKAVRNYLNKHAGTATDPLKDVEVPYGEGTKRWEELTDATIRGKKVSERFPSVEGARPGETVWELAKGYAAGEAPYNIDRTSAYRALQSHLSHVGDYLREHYPDPAKLAQVDLVRAVKETAKWDEEMAKRMAKERADMTAQMPVHKDYGDGYKWVEVKGVIDPAAYEKQGYYVKSVQTSDGLRYSVIGPDNRPKGVSGKTPEDAWNTLARDKTEQLLKDEGDQMGHCVGGYCDWVESGDSKIYSLRDAQGKSHVTIEVEPGLDRPGGVQVSDPNIIQIKGKQNRAPVAQYLPYVQDFVKSGKWGEVGDLENSGLTQVAGLDAIVKADVEKAYPNQAYITEAELQPFRVGPGSKQRGFIDPELNKILAGAGFGALAGLLASTSSERADALVDATIGAIAGAGAMSAAGRRAFNKVLKTADYGAGMLSTRVLEKSPELYRRWQQAEKAIIGNTFTAMAPGDEFFSALKKSKLETPALQAAILDNDWGTVRAALTPELNAQLDTMLKMQREVAENSRKLERFTKVREGFFPRVVKDYEGLQEALTPDTRRGLAKEMLDAEKEAARKGLGLTDGERTQVIDDFLRKRGASSFLPSYAKARKIRTVTEGLLPYYYEPVAGYHIRMREMIADQELAKFFGKDLENKTQNGQKYVDVDASVQKLLDNEIKRDKLSAEDYYEIRDMLHARWKGGERQEAGWVQDIQNAFRAGLLGNIPAAIMQYSDLGSIAAAQGFRNTMSAVMDKVLGKERLRAKDFGLIDHATADFITNRPSARFQNWMFSKSFVPDVLGGKQLTFAHADTVMKDVLANAALKNGEALAKLNDPAFMKKYGAIYGEDFPALVDALKKGEITPEVSEYVWHEMTRTQPLSKFERPELYLAHPNLRPATFLKSWALKQLDFVRREAYQEIKAGNRARGMANLMRYGLYAGISGATAVQVQRWMLGYDDELSASDIGENMAKLFALNEYTRDRLANRKIGEAVTNTVAPPFRIFSDIAQSTLKDPKTGESFGDPKIIRYLPGWGPILYAQLFGGAEKHNERLEAQKRREAREADPEFQERKRERQERNREKQLERRGLQPISDFRVPEKGLKYSDTPGYGVQSYIQETDAMLRNRAAASPSRKKNMDSVRREEIKNNIEAIKDPKTRRKMRGLFNTYDNIRDQIDMQRAAVRRRYES